MTYCFSNEGFKEFLKRKKIDVKKIDNSEFFLLEKLKGEDLFITTPICLSGPRNVYEIENLFFSLQEKYANFSGAYIQTRASFHERFELLEKYPSRINASYRTVFNINLEEEEDDWIGSMARDSRSRFKKIRKNIELYKIDWVNFEDFPTAEFCRELSTIYENNAIRSNFSDRYKFDELSWRLLLTDPTWSCIIVHDNSGSSGVAVIGRVGFHLDYTFAATHGMNSDMARVLIYESVKKYRKQFSTLCLGGGITEKDSLHNFKARMGTSTYQMLNMKYCTQDFYDRECGSGKTFHDISNGRWP